MTGSPKHPNTPTEPAGLSDAELRATLYFAVGVTSESGYAAYRLAVAGDRAATLTLEPADNSGYTIGTIQTDLGQHYQPNMPGGENVPRDLVSAYQEWARESRPDRVLTDQQAEQAIRDLGRDGNTIRAQQGRPVDATVKSRIDNFLATDEGVSWVHARDVAQIGKLMDRAIVPLQRSGVYRNATADDQVRLVAIVAKAFNQNEVRSTRLIEAIERNQYHSVAEVSAGVNNLSPRRSGRGDYFEEGRDKALLGAEVVIGLRNAHQDNPLATAWRNVLSNPLVNPTALGQDRARRSLTSEYPTIKNMFLHYDLADQFIQALDRGGTYQNAAVGGRDKNHFTGAGFYASGDDFVTWDRSGEGHAYIGGEWSEINRNDLSRTRNPDRTADLNINRDGSVERLLHIDPNVPVLPPRQQQGAQQPTQLPDLNRQANGSFGGTVTDPDARAFSTGDPDLDRLAAALFADDDRAIDEACARIAASPSCQASVELTEDLYAVQEAEERQLAQARIPGRSR